MLHRSLLASVTSLLVVTATWADNWPNWRGPTYDGISKEVNLPTSWSRTENVAWALKLPGMGCSTPAVWGDRLFLTCEAGEGDLIGLCVSTEGKELWRTLLGSNKRRARADEGNDASASPSTDGQHVYFFVGTGALGCFDFEGKEVWKFDVQERYGKFKIQFGMHSTPLLFGDRLYLMLIHSGGIKGGGSHVIALDKATGKEVWNVVRPSDGHSENEHSYASPCLWQGPDGEAQLIVHGNDYATSHRVSDGKEVWRVGGLNPKDRYNATLRFVASPVASRELIVVPSAKKGPVVGLKPEANGLVMPGSSFEAWRMPKGTPDVPSPLVYDGLVYLCGETGTLTCLDAKTGKEHYQERTHNSRHRASPVYADGKIYLTARDGTVSVVKAGPVFELLATNRLKDETAASPAISGGRIYLHSFETLWAIGK